MERYVSLQDLSKTYTLRESSKQVYCLIVIIVYNFVYYFPCILFFEVISSKFEHLSNSTNESLVIIVLYFKYSIQKYIISLAYLQIGIETRCLIADPSLESILPVMDLLNRVLIPSVLMVIASALLIKSVCSLRMGEFTEQLSNPDENGHREIRLAITSIILNLIYMFLTFPLPIILLLGDHFSEFFLYLNFNLFCLSYSTNFYVLFSLNSLFRKEFFFIFGNIFTKSQGNRPQELYAIN